MDLINAGRPLTLHQLHALGLTSKQIRCRLASGALRRGPRGVYVDGAVPDTPEIRLQSLALVIRPDQIAVDRTAAWIHGVDTFSAAEVSRGPAPEMCVLRGGTRTRHQDVRGRSRTILPAEILDVGSLRVTTPLRTALDLGCHLRRREGFAAMCELARKHGLTRQDMVLGSRAFAGRRGVIQLRSLASRVDARVESQREAWTLLTICDAGLPAPEPQHWILIDGVPTYRLDLAYPEHRICVEYNGREAHESSDEQREYDAERTRWLREHGWTVIVLRSGDFSGAQLDRWLRRLRDALDETYSSRRW